MQKCLALLAIIVCGLSAKPQAYLTADLDALKKQGKLTGSEMRTNPNGGTTVFKVNQPNQTTSVSTCSCWIERDSSFSVVPFNGSGASGGPGMPPNYENDDWSSSAVTLPFNFCLYGTNYNSLYINNNGNVSFGAPYSTFSAIAFPSNQYVMLAPFWSDVDTRGAASGYVYYKLTSTALIVQWDSVGYYQQHDDKRNTYQLIITNGSDPILTGGNNVSFCYKDMQWTTGDASGGTNGFGGTPATVGANKGDGANYFQVSLFDHAGTNYTNAAGSPSSGVDWLDNRSIVADVCANSGNIPPVAIDSICDTIVVNISQTIYPVTRFLSGDVAQTCTITSTGGTGFVVNNNLSGNTANVYWQFTGTAANVGYNTITFSAQDNGSGSNTTVLTKVIQVVNSLDVSSDNGSSIILFPNPSSSRLNIELGSYPKAQVTIRSILGKKILSKEITKETNSLDVVSLENGIYLAEIKTGNIIINKLFIKE